MYIFLEKGRLSYPVSWGKAEIEWAYTIIIRSGLFSAFPAQREDTTRVYHLLCTQGMINFTPETQSLSSEATPDCVGL